MRKNLEIDCYNKVIKTIEKYNLIKNGDKIIIGVSGGPDSICLLDILIKIKNKNQLKYIPKSRESSGKQIKILNNYVTFDIIVAHLNHMIRKEANDDERFVKEYCEKNNIQFYSRSIDVKKIANNNKISTEEAGRNARYDFFDEVLQKTGGNKIAIAHNKNDKVETIIMNELRGCGIAGLKGIEPQRGKYIRPLIECERQEIERYCNDNKLNPRIDKTNFENIYTRNKIRNVVIPYIKNEFNPNIIETIDRLSTLVIEQEEYIQNEVKEIYKEIVIKENLKYNSNINSIKTNNDINLVNKQTVISEKNNEEASDVAEYVILDLKKFNTKEKVIKSNIIIYTITRLFGTSKGLEKIHIEDIIKLCSNNIGNKFLTPNKNLKVLVKNGKIKFSKEYK